MNAEGEKPPEPRGFGEHTRGLSGEYAHEQGWGLEVEQRTKRPPGPQDIDGGKEYDYSAQDFGDEPVNMERVGAEAGRRRKRPAGGRLGSIQRETRRVRWRTSRQSRRRNR